MYASTGSFGVTPEGRIGEPRGALRVQAVDPVEARGQKKCCYLTTAACISAGLPDDCRELTLLRWFRDNILIVDSDGRRDVEEYYADRPGRGRGGERPPGTGPLSIPACSQRGWRRRPPRWPGASTPKPIGSTATMLPLPTVPPILKSQGMLPKPGQTCQWTRIVTSS